MANKAINILFLLLIVITPFVLDDNPFVVYVMKTVCIVVACVIVLVLNNKKDNLVK